jgi:dethiobiotin synthetase
MCKKIYVTGIGTDVGKTVVSAIVTEALNADYWKPIQAGDTTFGDTDKVKALISNSTSKFHPNAYLLNTPMSPHAAAEIDNIVIDINTIVVPKTDNCLIIEGAGGLLVPLNNTQTILDTIDKSYKVILVSRHYLGSINHTLMSLKILMDKGYDVSVIFNGTKNLTSEAIISKMTGVTVIGRIDEESKLTKEIIKKYADLFKENLQNI